MSRLKKVTEQEAEGQTAELYTAIKKSIGKVPNLYQGLGVNPKALAGYLGLSGSLKGAKLTNAEVQSISLAVGQYNACNYCLAGHTVFGKMSGLSASEMLANRQGGSEDQKRDALIKLTMEIVANKGKVSDATLNTFREVGYSDEYIPEILVAVVQNIFTNYYNTLNDTEVDFPAAPSL